MPPTSPGPIVFLCTGNAARSVMAEHLYARLDPDAPVDSAGTFVVEGTPLSWRTREALAAHGLVDVQHRSAQFGRHHADQAALVVAMAVEHVTWIRRQHPALAPITGTIKRLVRDLPSAPDPLSERVNALGLEAVEPEPWEDVLDPAGQEVDAYHACIDEVATLVAELHGRLGPSHRMDRTKARTSSTNSSGSSIAAK